MVPPSPNCEEGGANIYIYICIYIYMLHIYIYIYMLPPPDGPTFLLFEGYFGDEMQLFYLECPVRPGQHQLTLSKEILF